MVLQKHPGDVSSFPAGKGTPPSTFQTSICGGMDGPSETHCYLMRRYIRYMTQSAKTEVVAHMNIGSLSQMLASAAQGQATDQFHAPPLPLAQLDRFSELQTDRRKWWLNTRIIDIRTVNIRLVNSLSSCWVSKPDSHLAKITIIKPHVLEHSLIRAGAGKNPVSFTLISFYLIKQSLLWI